MKNTKDNKTYGVLITFMIIVITVIWALHTDPLPPNCHTTPSVDVGGTGLECD